MSDRNTKTELKFCKWFVALFIIFMVFLFIGGIICSVIFVKNICEPFKNSANFVACIQYTVSLALILAAVIIIALSLIKLSKWLIKVDLIKQLLNSSYDKNDTELIKKICDTLAEL